MITSPSCSQEGRGEGDCAVPYEFLRCVVYFDILILVNTKQYEVASGAGGAKYVWI